MMFFAFVVLVALALLGVWVFVKLAMWPRAVAKKRDHPQVSAINALSWGGLIITAGVGWLIALTWAYASFGPAASSSQVNDLNARIDELQTQLKALQA